MQYSRFLVLLLTLGTYACNCPGPEGEDAGPDASTADSSTADTASPDTRSDDSAVPDVTQADAQSQDGGPLDTKTPDSLRFDGLAPTDASFDDASSDAASDASADAGPDSGVDGGLQDAATGDTQVYDAATVDTNADAGVQLPPDPATVAPELDQTVAMDLHTATSFLYTGDSPIQTGVAEETIVPERVAVARGLVQDRDGLPLPGVVVTVLGHGEYGQTLTRADGAFDLAVNGGGLLTFVYKREGYLTVQRQYEAPWREYFWLPDVVLTPKDPNTTTIDFAEPIQVARGSLEQDADGARQATMLFSAGTVATLVMPDGSSSTLEHLTVSVTEYTVGPNGAAAMPAELPPTTAYTYCAELQVEEAENLGAASVLFDKPVHFYLENFIGFPTGATIPSGFYNRERAAWLASEDGFVVEILGYTEGKAEIDFDGDGIAETDALLQQMGVTDVERSALADLYPESPKSLWRVPLHHFSPIDLNTPLPTQNNQPPTVQTNTNVNSGCVVRGSILDCHNQTLGERIPVVGTPYSLNYRSNRASGDQGNKTFGIKLTDAMDERLFEVRLTVAIAGQRNEYVYQPSANLQHTFTWNGRDAYGREVSGEQVARVFVAHGYRSEFTWWRCPMRLGSAYFGRRGSVRVDCDYEKEIVDGQGNLSSLFRVTTTVWTFNRTTLNLGILGLHNAIGSWSLNVHHSYDFGARKLYFGDGTIQDSSGPEGLGIYRFAGGGTELGDDGPAAQARLGFPMGADVAADGSVYITDGQQFRIRKVSPEGTITTVAGTGEHCASKTSPCGDGGLATEAKLGGPVSIRLGPDGSIYFVDHEQPISPGGGCRLRRIRPDGVIEAFAGTGETCTDPQGGCGDEGPALQATFNRPMGIAISKAGEVYIADERNNRIRMVDTNGMIHTIAGDGTQGFGGDDGPAISAQLNHPAGVAIAPNGDIYFSDSRNRRIRRVDVEGYITTIAGDGSYCLLNDACGDGGPAEAATFSHPAGLRFSETGELYVADDSGHRVRMINLKGIITTVAGKLDYSGNNTVEIDGTPATNAVVREPVDIAFGADGQIYIVEFRSSLVRVLNRMYPSYAKDEFMLSSPSGREHYLFDARGRHLRTVYADTGATLLSFGYDPEGRFSWVEDSFGNRTEIERDSGGMPTSIVAPYGQQTSLAVDANGYLNSITDPGGSNHSFTYADTGLMEVMTTPRGFDHNFTYDGRGRITLDEDPAGGFHSLAVSRFSSSGLRIIRETAMGRRTRYDAEIADDGSMEMTNIFPGGLTTSSVARSNGSTTYSYTDGTVVETQSKPDPISSMQTALLDAKTVTPEGLTRNQSESNEYTRDSQEQLVSRSHSVQVNSKVSTALYDYSTMQQSQVTPEGRTRTTQLDALGRIVSNQGGNLATTFYTYDGFGRLEAITMGEGESTRQTELTYNNLGQIASLTNALQQTVDFEYDQNGRVTLQTMPDGGEIIYSYDADGNIQSITPPGRSPHVFTYTPVNLTEYYLPPDLGLPVESTQYAYNLDKQLTDIYRPDGKHVEMGYDDAGRLSTIDAPRGQAVHQYSDTTGRLESITTHDDEQLAFAYDGNLLVETLWRGTVSGTVSNTYNNDYRLASQSVNGESLATYSYDDDGLVTQAGALSIHRDAQNGLVTGTSLGSVTTSKVYNPFGELESSTAMFGSSTLLHIEYERDKLGRITKKTEVDGAVTEVFEYAYDLAGRLVGVLKDSVLVEEYAYDANGNRIYANVYGVSASATYDAQDRLLTYGDLSFEYTANGELLRKTNTSNGDVTEYDYDVFGNLRSVALPDGRFIEYVVDGRNRRIGKKVDGVLVKGWLYKDQLNPVAETDGSGAVIAKYVYGECVNCPEYLEKAGETYRVISDHLGSPRKIVSETTGVVVQEIRYDSFGVVADDSNGGWQPFGFAGGIYDGDSGLVRFGARDYDALVGRWTTKDVLLFSGGTGFYEYSRDDPLNYQDLDGRIPAAALLLPCFSGALVGGLVGATVAYLSTCTSSPGPIAPSVVGGAVGGCVSGAGALLIAPWAAAIVGGVVGGAIIGGWTSGTLQGTAVGGLAGGAGGLVGSVAGQVVVPGAAAGSGASSNIVSSAYGAFIEAGATSWANAATYLAGYQ